MALSANSPMTLEIGDFNDLPLIANGTVYEGSMIGLTSGYARALTAGDDFQGHAFQAVQDTSNTSGAKTVRVRAGRYRAQVTITSVAVTDVGKAVYASDDGTYTLTAASNSCVGKVIRYVTTNTCIVEFQTRPTKTVGAAVANATSGDPHTQLNALLVQLRTEGVIKS